jgi:hypothetical protein
MELIDWCVIVPMAIVAFKSRLVPVEYSLLFGNGGSAAKPPSPIRTWTC